MRIGMLQLNFTIGDLVGNIRKIIDGYERLCLDGAELVVCSELAIIGYPPKDLLESPDIINGQLLALNNLAENVGEIPLIVGVAERNTSAGKPLLNNAIMIRNKQVIARASKRLLPTYDVFDERRYFEPGRSGPCVVEYQGQKLGIIVCEDCWGGTENLNGQRLYSDDPVEDMLGCKPDILIIINASPYFWGKGNVRAELVKGIAEKLNCSVVYVNQVGGQDELVFDGRSFAMRRDGTFIGTAKSFKEDLVLVDTDSPSEPVYICDQGNLGELYTALVLGVRDYLSKTGFSRVVIGESGGIDSALTTCIAVDAIGRENVTAIGMPSRFSSFGSVNDARILCCNLGVEFNVISITEIYDIFGVQVNGILGWRDGDFGNDVTEENVQARIRGMILMAYSNRRGALVLSTGNKSELAVGYCTLYGDMCGGLSVISDIPKTLVFRLAEYVNRIKESPVIPFDIFNKAPSAELRLGQKDQDSLPPYDILDRILSMYIEDGLSPSAIIERGLPERETKWVIGKVCGNEYKRAQAPLGIKVTSKAFGSGRRFPIAMKMNS